ncbi:hypothetical protein C1H46_016040 [Malus baccata]|uniref:phosphoribosylformylglycinamidine cyclo-ligase n=1 Tax=Malus baccata TaxID=106549 RepID=A0A540MJ22_MALBA|nr:hypothetical protein C1H46_016040 [Malus baccata]
MAANAMTTAFKANTELSRCVKSSLRPSSSKANPNEAQLCRLPIGLPFNNFSSGLSLTLAGNISQSRRVMSVSKNNESSNDFSASRRGDDSWTYKDAGVDIDAGMALVDIIKQEDPEIGSFGGIVQDEILDDVCLVHGTDGVGTKLKLAFETGNHETIGIDLVAMNVNDIVTLGAKPISFQDYFATGRLDVDIAAKVIKGIRNGCKQSGCKLSGGETAEMPGFYKDGEYDLGGSAVGVVKKGSIIDGKNIVAGDVLIGLPSSGVHSNGFSLVRRVLADSGLSLKDQLPGGEAITLGEALMVPTVIYVKQVLDLIRKGGIKGVAHITGGGLTENIPRVFPKGLGAVIYKDSWEVPPVFKWIQEAGRVKDAEMRRTFNMGIGMVLVVSQEASHGILGEDGNGAAYKAYRIGEVASGLEGVTYM